LECALQPKIANIELSLILLFKTEQILAESVCLSVCLSVCVCPRTRQCIGSIKKTDTAAAATAALARWIESVLLLLLLRGGGKS